MDFVSLSLCKLESTFCLPGADASCACVPCYSWCFRASECLCPCEEIQHISLKKQSHAKLFTTEVRILLIQVIFEINTARSVRFSIGKSCLKNVTSTIMEIKMLLGFAIMPQSCTFFFVSFEIYYWGFPHDSEDGLV